MITVLRHDAFDRWLRSLRDGKSKARILARIRSAMAGNFGDCEAVGEGVCEMRIHTGPEYRVYFVRSGETVYILLCGGDKSTQDRDIRQAKLLAKDIKERP